jgi:hypothetical protein
MPPGLHLHSSNRPLYRRISRRRALTTNFG